MMGLIPLYSMEFLSSDVSLQLLPGLHLMCSSSINDIENRIYLKIKVSSCDMFESKLKLIN